MPPRDRLLSGFFLTRGAADMGLSCHCYDYSDFDSWWEQGTDSVPPPGTKCCECCAPLPAEPCETIILYEKTDEPSEGCPPHPEDVLPDPPGCEVQYRHWEQLYDEMERAYDDYRDENGWDSDQESYTTHDMSYRCERCAGLALALTGGKAAGGLGYCLIPPGELIECLGDYADIQGLTPRKWVRGKDGVFNPEKKA